MGILNTLYILSWLLVSFTMHDYNLIQKLLGSSATFGFKGLLINARAGLFWGKRDILISIYTSLLPNLILQPHLANQT